MTFSREKQQVYQGFEAKVWKQGKTSAREPGFLIEDSMLLLSKLRCIYVEQSTSFFLFRCKLQDHLPSCDVVLRCSSSCLAKPRLACASLLLVPTTFSETQSNQRIASPKKDHTVAEPSLSSLKQVLQPASATPRNVRQSPGSGTRRVPHLPCPRPVSSPIPASPLLKAVRSCQPDI